MYVYIYISIYVYLKNKYICIYICTFYVYVQTSSFYWCIGIKCRCKHVDAHTQNTHSINKYMGTIIYLSCRYIKIYTRNAAFMRGIPFPNKCQCCCNRKFLWEKNKAVGNMKLPPQLNFTFDWEEQKRC